jgi:hypothetical protein
MEMFVLLAPWTREVDFTDANVKDFYIIRAFKRWAMVFNKGFGVQNQSLAKSVWSEGLLWIAAALFVVRKPLIADFVYQCSVGVRNEKITLMVPDYVAFCDVKQKSSPH